MSKLNWSKASSQSRIRKHGSEQGSEFGDVIDKARRAAAIENAKLASGAVKLFPKKGKRKKSVKLRSSQEVSSPQDTKALEKTAESPGSASPSKAKASSEFPNAKYVASMVALAEKSGKMVAFRRIINDYLVELRKNKQLIQLPSNERRMIEALLVVHKR